MIFRLASIISRSPVSRLLGEVPVMRAGAGGRENGLNRVTPKAAYADGEPIPPDPRTTRFAVLTRAMAWLVL
jgi:hypothetical protein